MKTLLEIRNNLYNNIPTGEIKAFELIVIISQHLKELDEYINKLPSITKD